jgi:hypothetical protein
VNPRTRLVVFALAVAAVASMLLLARCGGCGDGTPSSGPSLSAPAASVASPTGNADVDAHDDGAVDAPDVQASIAVGPADANEAAITVVVKLLNTTGKSPEQWRNDLRPFVDDALFGQLADADPAKVPVGRVDDGHVTSAVAGDGLVQASVPVVAGNPAQLVATVRVMLSGGSGRWLATELDVVRP